MDSVDETMSPPIIKHFKFTSSIRRIELLGNSEILFMNECSENEFITFKTHKFNYKWLAKAPMKLVLPAPGGP